MNLQLSYLGLNFSVSASDAQDLHWLCEFLEPFYRVSEPGSTVDIEVSMQVDADRFNAVLRAGPIDTEQSLDAFCLDNQTISLPVWNGPQGQLTLYEEKFRLFYLISKDRRRVDLLAERGPAYRTALMRVLREYAMNQFMRAGGVYFHASAVAIRDQGLLIVGARNAGKTSLMTHFLRHCEADYIANDRVHVDPAADPLSITGMPTIATIRTAMPPLFPGLEEQMAQSCYHHHLTLAECANNPRRLRAWSNGKFGLTPRQLMNLHSTQARAQARPVAILFPRVVADSPGSQAMRAVRIDQDSVASRVPDALFGSRTLRNRAEVFTLSGPGLPAVTELLQRCQQVATALPCFEIQLGEEAYRSPAASDGVLATVLEGL